ncbi:uncharacterized protein LOC135699956 [Ochlerotatus camptorhynchus]|uniref:uncharacterized protein LOC135699956 n=1 Tax=Ochlerotatus camptorhynchus TaxID=644619 RepID=UPI0031DBC602
MLLKGPDQLVSLLGVLCRFRQFKIAVGSDVKEMFSQILMRAADKHSQRILWRLDPSQDPEIFLVDVATFGSTCSPASAQFVKNTNAREHSVRYPRAAEGILQRTYVDDYLDSFGSEEEALRISEEVRQIFRNGGFELRNWISNNEGVLDRLGETQAATSKSLVTTSTTTERVLGMVWDPVTDELSFSTRMSDEVQYLLENDRIPTKRQVLRCVMTLFDPLGLLATFLIHGKILVQDLCRWIKMISYIANVRIPRCYFPEASAPSYEVTELHVFVDANPLAYSCALYLRTITADGTPQCTLIAVKAKVASLNDYTEAGTSRMSPGNKNDEVRASQPLHYHQKTNPRNYRPFVANRVGEILENTTVDEWRWVPSESNAADEATKWGSGPYFSSDSKWFNGPEFLHFPEHEWPHSTDLVVDTAVELRSSVLFHTTWEAVIAYERFSKWERLQRSMAYVLRFIFNVTKKGEKRSGRLAQQELDDAENEVLKQVLKENFADEVTTLKNNQVLPEDKKESIDRSSIVYQLMPMMDERGLMRQNSRIAAAKDIHHSVRFPVILPRMHRCTELLVARYHRLYRHANSETVVNEVRQLFIIPKLRSVVKQIGRSCQFCKIRKALPTIPPMAPLPPARLAIHDRPFSYVGVDYFGPLFVCRRGSPVEFFSDNATNSHGAERQLREQINEGVTATFTSANTKWTFIPPSAPHMGGAWERLVRSVKAAIGDAYREGKLNDEELQTVIVKAEGIVNTRPLTYLPLDSAESESLTPNHFLLGSSNGVKQPSVCIEPQQGVSRDLWNHIMRQLNRFWQRWLKEYLPVMRRQTKWYDEARCVQDGDLVLIADEGQRNGWTRGIVIESIIAPDGHVRQAMIKTAGGVLRRPVSKLVVLDVSSSSAVIEASGPHSGEDVSTGTLTD